MNSLKLKFYSGCVFYKKGGGRMKCQEVCKHLSEYMDSELDKKLKKDISAHLLACSSCRAQLDQLQQMRSVLLKMPELSPPSGFRNNLMLKIKDIKKRDDRKVVGLEKVAARLCGAVRASWYKTLTAAAVFCVAIGIASLWGGGIENIDIVNNSKTSKDLNTGVLMRDYKSNHDLKSNSNEEHSSAESGIDINLTDETTENTSEADIKENESVNELQSSSDSAGSSNQNTVAEQGSSSGTSQVSAEKDTSEMTAGESTGNAVEENSSDSLNGLPEAYSGDLLFRDTPSYPLLISSLKAEVLSSDVEADTEKLINIALEYGRLLTTAGGTVQFVVNKTEYSTVLSEISSVAEKVSFKESQQDVTKDYNELKIRLSEKTQRKNELLHQIETASQSDVSNIKEDLALVEAELSELETKIVGYQKSTEEVSIIVELVAVATTM